MTTTDTFDIDRSTPDYDRLVAFLHERFDDDLRWVASFDTDTYGYDVRYIRDDLKTDLSTRRLDIVVHRSIALLKRPTVEQVYSHLGRARSLVIQHDRATAVHIYLGDTTGVVVKIRAGNDVSVPGFVEECLAALYGPDAGGQP